LSEISLDFSLIIDPNFIYKGQKMMSVKGEEIKTPEKKEIARIMAFTEIVYYSDGSTDIVRSFNKPLSKTTKTKREIRKQSYVPKEDGVAEL